MAQTAAANSKTAPDAHFYLGRIARQEGRVEEAATELKRSLALKADQPDALAELGQIGVQARDFSHAADYLDQPCAEIQTTTLRTSAAAVVCAHGRRAPGTAVAEI